MRPQPIGYSTMPGTLSRPLVAGGQPCGRLVSGLGQVSEDIRHPHLKWPLDPIPNGRRCRMPGVRRRTDGPAMALLTYDRDGIALFPGPVRFLASVSAVRAGIREQ